MECIILGKTECRRTAWQVEDLGPEWRCCSIPDAGQALQLIQTRPAELVILTAGDEGRTLLDMLQAQPMLAPPYVMGAGIPAPDGLLPELSLLPAEMRRRKCTGKLPALCTLRLQEATALAQGLLHALGVPPGLRAWDFLPAMAALPAVHPPLLTDMQHGLYPLTARRHKRTAAAVERSLRLCVEQISHSIFSYKSVHFHKHIISLELIFLNGIMLSVCTESDTVFKLVHIVDVVHPAAVNASEHNYTLNLTYIFAEKFFLRLVCCVCLFLDFLSNVFGCKVIEVTVCKIKLASCEEHILNIICKTKHIPVVCILCTCISCHCIVDNLVNHLADGIAEVVSVKNLAALFVNYVTLLIHNIIILKDIFSCCVVLALYLFSPYNSN